jgi:hypothetical protein
MDAAVQHASVGIATATTMSGGVPTMTLIENLAEWIRRAK